MTQPRNIVIVGGVAGGMSCAARLRRLDEDAKITIFEKGPYISYANCGIPYALGGVIESEAKLHVMTAAKVESWFNVDVRSDSELVSIDRSSKTVQVQSQANPEPQTVPYDKLVLALGAEAFRPPIKGINAPHVFTLQTIPQLQQVEGFIAQTTTTAQKCQNAVVIGGGFIGLEAAENLVFKGLNVTLLEVLPHVMPPIDTDMAEPLHKELRRNGVSLMMSAKIGEIVAPTDSAAGYVTVSVGGEESNVPADMVIVATGVRPRISIPQAAGLETTRGGMVVNEHMQTSDPDIYAVGDMAATPNLITSTDMNLALAGPANRQGRMAADHICGRETRYRGNVATSVCKVFDLSVATVGFSTEALTRMGKMFEYVTVHPPDHASYYPGAEPMTLKLAFEPPSGTLLGAQIVGAKGVDKRIDVLAMAIRAGMTIFDLEHVELAYAPPYGSAKDPVNMAGFCGSNVLRGDVKIVHAASLAVKGEGVEGYEVVDVRTPGEYAQGHVKGAKNIPLNDLRERIGEIQKESPVIVYCKVGYRGYLAYRILQQKGFDVFNLDGGFKAVSEGGYDALCAEKSSLAACN